VEKEEKDEDEFFDEELGFKLRAEKIDTVREGKEGEDDYYNERFYLVEKTHDPDGKPFPEDEEWSLFQQSTETMLGFEYSA